MESVRNIETKYYGIWIVEEELPDGKIEYFISDDRGGDQWFGDKWPTEEDVDNYLESLDL